MAGSSQLVKELREKTGAGILDCQKALNENGNDVEKAVDYLRQKGLAAAAKKAGRETNQGLIHSYIHMGGKIGVLIEVNCETDFVARNEEFKAFVNDLALQVAAAKPSFVKREDLQERLGLTPGLGPVDDDPVTCAHLEASEKQDREMLICHPRLTSRGGGRGRRETGVYHPRASATTPRSAADTGRTGSWLTGPG